MLQRDGELKLEAVQREKESKKNKLILLQQQIEKQKVKFLNQEEEMKIVEDKLKECEQAIPNHRKKFNTQEENLKGLELKLHEQVTESVRTMTHFRLPSPPFRSCIPGLAGCQLFEVVHWWAYPWRGGSWRR